MSFERDGDSQESRRFLRLLGARDSTSLYWVTFGDRDKKSEGLSFTQNGPLSAVLARLRALNGIGAGVFLCLGRVQGSELLRRNVLSVNVLVLDLDKAPLPRCFQPFAEPHLVVSTSPGRWHCYWRLQRLPLEAFPILQRQLARRFGGDRSVDRLEQIMRVPGFLHHKGTPYRSHIIRDNIEAPLHSFRGLAEACTSVDVTDGSVDHESIPWLRDRVTGRITDERFLAHAVWSEALTLRSRDPSEVAQRARARIERVADSGSLGSARSCALAESVAERAIEALLSSQTEQLRESGNEELTAQLGLASELPVSEGSSSPGSEGPPFQTADIQAKGVRPPGAATFDTGLRPGPCTPRSGTT